jgi:hypothetical protein
VKLPALARPWPFSAKRHRVCACIYAGHNIWERLAVVISASNLLHYPFVVAFAQARARVKAQARARSEEKPALSSADQALLDPDFRLVGTKAELYGEMQSRGGSTGAQQGGAGDGKASSAGRGSDDIAAHTTAAGEGNDDIAAHTRACSSLSASTSSAAEPSRPWIMRGQKRATAKAAADKHSFDAGGAGLLSADEDGLGKRTRSGASPAGAESESEEHLRDRIAKDVKKAAEGVTNAKVCCRFNARRVLSSP